MLKHVDTGVLCPLLNVSNAQLNTTIRNYTTAVRVTCNHGFAFSSLEPTNNTANTTCMQSGSWSTDIDVCQSMFAELDEIQIMYGCDNYNSA